MARASFTTLPVELKARIVEMTSDQEGMWKTRVEDSKEEKEAEDADHINCLSSLALVNKELRELAAKHQFKLLPADRASHPVFRFIVLPRHGHRFTAIRLDDNDPMDGAELALSCMGQLPALRELNMTSQIASDLFGPGVTLRPDSDDMTTSTRASALEFIAPRIEKLVLGRFQPSETVALIRRFPNLKTLWLIGLGDPDEDGHLHEFASAIASLRHLEGLSIELVLGASGMSWPVDALAPFERDPPPLKSLELFGVPLDSHTLSFIALFPTVDFISLETTPAQDPAADVASNGPIQLPRLIYLELNTPRAQIPHLLRILTSHSTLSHLALYNPPDDPLLPTDPTFLTFLDQQPSLNRLWLWDNSLNNGPGVNQESSPLPPPSFLSAYDRLVRSRGLDPSVLDQPHLGPFHPNAKLDFTKEDHEHLAGSLRRTLEFGLFELDRMVAEGSVARTVEWVPMLKALELERLAWKD